MLQLVDFLNESRGQAIINRAGNRPLKVFMNSLKNFK